MAIRTVKLVIAAMSALTAAQTDPVVAAPPGYHAMLALERRVAQLSGEVSSISLFDELSPERFAVVENRIAALESAYGLGVDCDSDTAAFVLGSNPEPLRELVGTAMAGITVFGCHPCRGSSETLVDSTGSSVHASST